MISRATLIVAVFALGACNRPSPSWPEAFLTKDWALLRAGGGQELRVHIPTGCTAVTRGAGWSGPEVTCPPGASIGSDGQPYLLKDSI